jgi:hypothetical protein
MVRRSSWRVARRSVRVRRSSIKVWRSSVKVRRSSVRLRRSLVRVGVAQVLVLWLAVMRVRVLFFVRHFTEVFPTELTCDKEMEKNLGEWPRMCVFYECN